MSSLNSRSAGDSANIPRIMSRVLAVWSSDVAAIWTRGSGTRLPTGMPEASKCEKWAGPMNSTMQIAARSGVFP